MECHIYRQPFVLVRQIKDKTNKLAKTKQERQDNYKAREDNSRLPNKPKTCQKDNLYKGQDNSEWVRQSSHSVGQLNCLGHRIFGRTIL